MTKNTKTGNTHFKPSLYSVLRNQALPVYDTVDFFAGMVVLTILISVIFFPFYISDSTSFFPENWKDALFMGAALILLVSMSPFALFADFWETSKKAFNKGKIHQLRKNIDKEDIQGIKTSLYLIRNFIDSMDAQDTIRYYATAMMEKTSEKQVAIFNLLFDNVVFSIKNGGTSSMMSLAEKSGNLGRHDVTKIIVEKLLENDIPGAMVCAVAAESKTEFFRCFSELERKEGEQSLSAFRARLKGMFVERDKTAAFIDEGCQAWDASKQSKKLIGKYGSLDAPRQQNRGL